MYSYKKSYIILILSFLIAAPSLRAASDYETLAVPSMTGIVSGYIYGVCLQKSWIGLILANIFISRCKDRIFAALDKDYTAKKQSAVPMSITCESTGGSDGIQRTTYSFKVNEGEESATQSKYEVMSDYDDMVTIATVLAVLMRG